MGQSHSISVTTSIYCGTHFSCEAVKVKLSLCFNWGPRG